MDAWGIFSAVGGFVLSILIGVITTLETSNRIAFAVAKGCFVVGALDVLGYATHMAFHAPTAVAPFYFLALIPLWGIVFPALILALEWVSDREWLVSPYLKPGTTLAPSTPQNFQPPEGSLLVCLGSNFYCGTQTPHTVLVLDDEPAIVLDKDNRGNLLISKIKVYDDLGDAVVSFENHSFETGPTAWKPKRPDPHTLVAYDRKKNEVLRLKFLNPKVLTLTGKFCRQGGLPPLVITDSAMRIGGMIFASSSFLINGGCGFCIGATQKPCGFRFG